MARLKANDHHADSDHGGCSFDEIVALGVQNGHFPDQTTGTYGITDNATFRALLDYEGL